MFVYNGVSISIYRIGCVFILEGLLYGGLTSCAYIGLCWMHIKGSGLWRLDCSMEA